MARLFFHFFAIYSNENLPISIQVVPKWVHNFAQYQMNLENIANISTFCFLSPVCVKNCVPTTGHFLKSIPGGTDNGMFLASIHCLNGIKSQVHTHGLPCRATPWRVLRGSTTWGWSVARALPSSFSHCRRSRPTNLIKKSNGEST